MFRFELGACFPELIKVSEIEFQNCCLFNMHSTISNWSKNDSKIKRKLGFPDRPTVPLAPYLRFCRDTPTKLLIVRKRHPNDVFNEIAGLWNTTDVTKKVVYWQKYVEEMVSVRSLTCPLSSVQTS